MAADVCFSGFVCLLLSMGPSLLSAQQFQPMPALQSLERQGRETGAIVPTKPVITSVQNVSPAGQSPEWKALKERVMQPENLLGKTRPGEPDYQFYVISTRQAVEGQSCPVGSTLENAVLISKPNPGPERTWYPVRIRAMCTKGKDILGLVGVDLDWDGTILRTPVTDPQNSRVHPWCDTVTERTAQSYDFSSCLNRLVRLFLMPD